MSYRQENVGDTFYWHTLYIGDVRILSPFPSGFLTFLSALPFLFSPFLTCHSFFPLPTTQNRYGAHGSAFSSAACHHVILNYHLKNRILLKNAKCTCSLISKRVNRASGRRDGTANERKEESSKYSLNKNPKYATETVYAVKKRRKALRETQTLRMSWL